MRFDSVQLGSADLSHAAARYADLLGIAPQPSAPDRVRFDLEHGAVELAAGPPGIRSVRFALGNDVPPDGEPIGHGLTVLFDATPRASEPARAGTDAINAIDHIVIHSPNLDRAIRLWRDRLGLRLALDHEFQGRGLRMLFFRSGGVTLEFVSPLTHADDPGAPDRFVGVAYRTREITACLRRLTDRGFTVSPVRPGNKSGTTVATVRGGVDAIPTLLIEDPSRDR